MELEALRKDMVAAMKAKDKVTKDAVSSPVSYTHLNAEIADLLFSTADDLGDPEVYGRGVINPVKLWEEVAAMEARKGNDEQNN